ncbi:hypothetical protein D3C87_1871920 [compost metagenome]
MEKERPLFEQTFFDLHSGLNESRLKNSPQSSLYQTESFKEVRKTLENFTAADQEKTRHPYFQQSRACSLIIDELEAIWLPIAEKDDWSLFEQKLQEIRSFRGLY